MNSPRTNVNYPLALEQYALTTHVAGEIKHLLMRCAVGQLTQAVALNSKRVIALEAGACGRFKNVPKTMTRYG